MSLSNLPPEMVLMIASYLNDGDYISLANTNRRFLQLLSVRKYVDVFPLLALKLSIFYPHYSICFLYFRELNLFTGYFGTKTFLVEGTAPTAVTKLDVGNCYWLDPSLLPQLITRLSASLTSLHVQGTKLSSLQVATILKECPGIVELSVSFFKDDTSFWLPGSQIPSAHEDLKVGLKSSVFQDLVAKVNQLTRLSLYGDVDSFPNFIVFLRYISLLDLYQLHIH